MATGNSYLLALDQGTTSSRALLIDQQGQVAGMAQQEFRQIYPEPGWVEHDAQEIWDSQAKVVKDLLTKLSGQDRLVGVGITNQRETTIVWDRKTGRPIANAIVWQDRRTAAYCEQLKAQGLSERIQSKTGLVIDAYFSASKIRWLLEKIPGARDKAQRGELAAGTVDSWLIWNLTRGQVHATDATNASRTMLYNIHNGSWDQELLDLFEIPKSMLPEVKSSSEVYGNMDKDLFGHAAPIAGVAGDQQAALFGQLCIEPGMMKNTYGTGCFLVLNTGNKPITSQNKLLTTVAWRLGKETTYALEGSVFIGGAVVQWLRDGLGLIANSKDIEALAAKAKDNGGVYFVPAFTGLGAPYWDPYARGTIIGLTRGTGREHIARAALEAIAYQTRDVVEAMRADANIPLKELRVDGGASANPQLMQFQADLLAAAVVRPRCLESTAMGAAYFAGLATGFFPHMDALKGLWQKDVRYEPRMQESERRRLYGMWKAAIKHASGWARDAEVGAQPQA
ncbi:MAG TPA: glycerol kinase GlpK [Oligoflexus sp.]|uniref:glycerol kinase GlpK n=1 Tax=Oligoflexus sp. TaxID=1971216 RepID=UPI002D7F84D6|nr:glycerol kinase GlpK [Oligoflexus sp.]HET9235940.1 glycerol kinase GlpK [Oligoflexus sp.]